ncbi:MAG: diaminopimelate decarboxylase [bacterium]|nr:diaminopimelate decarboxylase [bacterium]
MPMSKEYQNRLFPILPEVVRYFDTPFIILDKVGIFETVENMKVAFQDVNDNYGFKQFFALKTCPLPAILDIMRELNSGLDCSSKPELAMGRSVGFYGEEIIFSSNDTSQEEFKAALTNGGCILNLDDITMVKKVPKFPNLICFRYNPEECRSGNEIIGNPKEAKYGLRDDQVIPAYQQAIERGAERFGLHTMICSNEINYKYMVETVQMLLEVVERVSGALGIKFEFINIGGGIGIPQRPGENPFNIQGLGREAKALLDQFKQKYGYAPKLFTEYGRYITGPHGALVARVINRMSKPREYVGLDASMVDFMRPGVYGEKVYHHITVLDKKGRPKEGPIEIVDVSGPMCENNDKFAIQRSLPKVIDGDIIILEDAGAHGRAMGSNYNGRLRCQELLLGEDGNVEMVRRPETIEDYFATLKFGEKILKLNRKEVQ